MKAEKWVLDLKVGDEVIVKGGGFEKTERLGKVVRKTPSGRVVVSPSNARDLTFSADGWQYGGGSVYFRASIAQCTPADIERLRAQRERENLSRRLGAMSWNEWQTFPLETLRAVRDLLAEGKEKK